MSYILDQFLNHIETKEDWNEVWDIVRARYGMWEAQQGKKFHINDSVTFDIDTGRNRGHYSGIITKMTTRTATIQTSRLEWHVGYSFLKLIFNQPSVIKQ